MGKFQDSLKGKKREVVSTEEALKDVEPFFSTEELQNILKNNIKIAVEFAEKNTKRNSDGMALWDEEEN